jgi:hydroxymethylbilane synthase
MGGGCQSPVAAYAQIEEDRIHLRAVSFRDGPARRAEGRGEISQAAALGEQVAQELMPRQRP